MSLSWTSTSWDSDRSGRTASSARDTGTRAPSARTWSNSPCQREFELRTWPRPSSKIGADSGAVTETRLVVCEISSLLRPRIVPRPSFTRTQRPVESAKPRPTGADSTAIRSMSSLRCKAPASRLAENAEAVDRRRLSKTTPATTTSAASTARNAGCFHSVGSKPAPSAAIPKASTRTVAANGAKPRTNPGDGSGDGRCDGSGDTFSPSPPLSGLAVRRA